MNPTLRLPSGLRRALASRLARPVRPDQPPVARRACLYKVDRLGDFVLALGILRRLLSHYGPEQCRLVVSSVAEPLAAAEFPRVPRWTIPPATSGVWRELRPLRGAVATAWSREVFADLVCLRHAANLHRDATLGWIHARTWHGLGPRPSTDRLANENRPTPVAGYPAAAGAPWSRELLAHRLLLEQITGRPASWPDLRPELRSVRSSSGAAWVFCPFGSETIRDYPPDLWVEAWREAALPPGPVHLLGPAARASELAALGDRLKKEAGRSAVEVATDLPAMDFVHCLAAARGVVTVDSAAAHLATAFDKPAVVVTGGGHFGWFCPWGESPRQRWLAHQLPCFGCNWVCRFETVRCVVELPPAAIARALQAVSVDV